MANLLDIVNHHYSLSALEGLDPRNPDEMAQIIIGMYVVHASAAKRLQDVQGINSGILELAQTVAKGKNVGRVAELIGFRTLTVVDISGDREPIRYKGFNPVPQAVGRLASAPLEPTRPLLFVPRNLDQLRIVEEQAVDWYSVQVIDDPEREFEPLVDITVAS